MKLEPKPVLQATFYVALLVGLFVLIIILPQWVDRCSGAASAARDRMVAAIYRL
jgi:flagellar biosynthesis protein FliR